MKLCKLAFLLVPLLLLTGCGDAAPPEESTPPWESSHGESLADTLSQPAESSDTSISIPSGEDGDMEPDTPEPAKGADGWKRVYAAYLADQDVAGFYIGDINGDGLPELVTCYTQDDLEYGTHSGTVGYFTEEGFQTLDLQVISIWGKAGYLEETSQIVFLQWYGHTTGTFGSVDFYLYDWTPEGYVETRSVIRESGYDADNDGNGVYGQGYIDGEEAEFDQFEIALAEMYGLLERSAWFPMTDAGEVEDYYDYFI